MSSKIKIAFFAEILIEDFDGASRTIFNIIRRIPKERFEVMFFCGIPPEEPFDFPYVVVPTMGIPFNKDYSLAIPHLVYFQLQQKLKKFNPDIVHISTPSFLGNYALNFAKAQNISVTSIYHTHFISYIDYYLEKIPYFITPVKNWVIRNQKAFYEKCSIVYVPTKSMVSELESYSISSTNFRIWPRGINTERYSPEKRDVKKIRAITGNPYPNILFASRLVWEKNLKTLVRIYKDAEARSLKVNFIIAGDGVAKESLIKQMPKAIFLGCLDHEELSSIYASSDVFVFTSVSETYGNVVAEAMASGLPCVIANGGGSAHFIEHGVNGYLCQPEDSREYLANIEQILENEALSASFSKKGLDYTSRLKWENLTASYFNDLENLALQQQALPLPAMLDLSF